jgi:peptidoglycan/xylan/chitin deacetylase (PgdA/CDA1 family)
MVLASGVYASFGPAEKWVQLGPEIDVDTTRFGEGRRSLRMVSTNGRPAGAESVLGAPRARLIQADVYVEDPASCARIEFLLTSNGTAWLAKVNKNPTLARGWNRLQFSINDCAVQGSGMSLADWDNITKVRLYFMSKPDTTATIWIGQIRWLRTKAALTFTFDDGRSGCHDHAMPILGAYGWAATIYVVTDAVGQHTYRFADSGDFIDPLKLDQLRALQDAGWDISSHSCSHRNLLKATTEQRQHEMQDSKEWLVKQGFSSGARFFATPYGHRDAEVQAMASKLYENLRDTYSSIGYETPLNTDFAVNTRYQLRAQGLESLSRTPFAKFRSWVDTAIASGTWLIIVGHSVDGPGGWLDPDLFRQYLNYVDTKRNEIDVLTMSQYWDRRDNSKEEFSTNLGLPL